MTRVSSNVWNCCENISLFAVDHFRSMRYNCFEAKEAMLVHIIFVSVNFKVTAWSPLRK